MLEQGEVNEKEKDKLEEKAPDTEVEEMDAVPLDPTSTQQLVTMPLNGISTSDENLKHDETVQTLNLHTNKEQTEPMQTQNQEDYKDNQV